MTENEKTALIAEGDRYFAEAKAYQRERKCRWSEACHAIKRRHPEARDAMQAASSDHAAARAAIEA